MKTSVSLSLFEAKEGMPVLFSGNIDENIPYIRDLGYHGVDLLVRDPKEEVSRRAQSLLKENGLGVSVILPAALAGEGLFLCHQDESIRKEAVSRMSELIQFASELEGHLALGLPRGNRAEGETEAEALERFVQSVEQLLPESERLGVKMCVEPINRYEINTLNNAKETCDFVRESGLPLKMMPDTFHMNIEDVSINESLRYCKDYIQHVHFVDSNRLAPGMGHTDMEDILATLKEIKYDGYLGLEVLPRPDARTCARKGIEFFERTGVI